MAKPEPKPSSASQRLLLGLLLVGAVCAAILAVMGVCTVLSAVLGMLPTPAFFAIGAALGLIAYRVRTR